MTINDYYQRISEIIESGTSIKLHADAIYNMRLQMEELGLLSDEDRVIISNKIRGKVQSEAESALFRAKLWGAIYMATGTGKSKIAADISDLILKERESWDTSRPLIVVPTEKLRDENWREEFHKWGYQDSWESVERCCYASLAKYENEHFSMVILDEGHNITENNSTFFTKNKVDACILLTATKPEKFSIKNEILKALRIDSVYEISLDEAVKLGLVAPYDITIVTTHLNNVDKFPIGGSKKAPFNQTEQEKYKYLSKLAITRPSKAVYLKRMRFIYDLHTKTEAAKYILENVIPKELRTLIFCGSIDQAETLCDHSFHSKRNDTDYNLFKEKKINRLSCVNALNEGDNIDDLDCGFIVQLNSKELHLIQRIGRTVRFRPGHIAKIIILCVKDTVDEQWVNNATKNLNAAKTTRIELSRLKMELEQISFT
jgi:superfamily II DNA or RNA helicase